MYQMMGGEAGAPKLPIIFIAADSVAPYLPPTSMQAPHEPGITRSLLKLASPIAIMAGTGLCMRVETIRRRLAPLNPTYASRQDRYNTHRRRRVSGRRVNPLTRD